MAIPGTASGYVINVHQMLVSLEPLRTLHKLLSSTISFKMQVLSLDVAGMLRAKSFGRQADTLVHKTHL